MQRKHTPRIALAILVVTYLLCDLLIFDGPLRHQFNLLDPASSASNTKATTRGIVARVFDQAITRSQLDRAVAERLWLNGKSSDAATLADRQAALDELIDHELLKATIKSATSQPAVSKQEIDERIRRLVGRFETKGSLEKAMKSQGIRDEKALKNRLAARIQQEKYIISKITATPSITDEEVRAWYAQNLTHLGHPERVEARHIFISTLGRAQEDAKRVLEATLTKLTTNQQDFTTLAKEISQDPATRENGGNLGWMTRNRIPADLSAPIFSLKIAKPTLVRSRMGWHLVEVTARQPAKARAYDDAKPEIIATLEALKRGRAIAEFRANLRKQETANVVIFDYLTPPQAQ